MSSAPPNRPRTGPGPPVVLIAITLVSAALIAYEIVLMRRLLIERWHHFGYLVISVALLGFGASGTLLALFRRRVTARPQTALWVFTLGLLGLLVTMPRLAAMLPVSARFIPDDLWRQVGWWSLYWLSALLPFLCGAACIGTALIAAGPRVGRMYAASLFGSAGGAVGAALVISRFSIECALWPSLTLTAIALCILSLDRPRRLATTLIVGAVVFVVAAGWPLPPDYDEHKYAARVEQLAAQGSARRVARAADPHGYVEVYDGDLFHDLPFLALTQRPPAMLSVLVNGDPAGSVFKIQTADQAAVMDHTLMAFPYRLISPRPRVLLIGETGGTNVWLARRRDARDIVVVQPNAALLDVLSSPAPLAETIGHVFDLPEVSITNGDPRRYLAHHKTPAFDLIQIVTLEGLGSGSAGMRGLAEDHLVTVEGLAAGLNALSDNGVLAISRGIQSPERENIRLLATLTAALESLGLDHPDRHIVQVRDYLGVCTLALKSALTDERRAALRAAIREFNLTPVWYDGLPSQEVNKPDQMPGPPESSADWLHHAAREIFSPHREAFFDAWLLNVRPPHDDSPFFWDFYKPGAITALEQAYGPLWLTRAELGRLFLYTSLVIASAAAVILILVPLAVVQLRSRTAPAPWRDTLWTCVYFAAIGLGFMGLEMALISRAIRVLGDPVIASATVIGGVLVLSGLGSLTADALPRARRWLAPLLVALLALALRSLVWQTDSLVALAACAAVLAYFMGIPMPIGLALLQRRAPTLIPWAWGINGVASVLATSAAIVVAMTAGYRWVLLLAAALYLVATLSLQLVRARRPT